MSVEYRAKVFRSGNSLALRLPKALGLTEGAEMILRAEQDHYVVEPAERPKRKFNIAKVAGSAKSLREIASEDRLFAPRPSEIAASDRS